MMAYPATSPAYGRRWRLKHMGVRGLDRGPDLEAF